MDMRGSFERWATEEGYSICCDTSNQYRNVSTRAAWEVWQARQKEIDSLKAEIEELREVIETPVPWVRD